MQNAKYKMQNAKCKTQVLRLHSFSRKMVLKLKRETRLKLAVLKLDFLPNILVFTPPLYYTTKLFNVVIYYVVW
jgi:hypothetical protein